MKCWYCSVREASEDRAYAFDMHGNVAAESKDSQTNVAYNVKHIVIPRCEDCHSKHRLATLFKYLCAVFAVIAVATFLLLLFSGMNRTLLGILLGLFLGLSIAAITSCFIIQKGISTVAYSRKKHPDVIELLNQCYRYGSRPKEQLPSTDLPCDNKAE